MIATTRPCPGGKEEGTWGISTPTFLSHCLISGHWLLLEDAGARETCLRRSASQVQRSGTGNWPSGMCLLCLSGCHGHVDLVQISLCSSLDMRTQHSYSAHVVLIACVPLSRVSAALDTQASWHYNNSNLIIVDVHALSNFDGHRAELVGVLLCISQVPLSSLTPECVLPVTQPASTGQPGSGSW